MTETNNMVVEKEPENEPKNENGILTINPDDYYKCVVFELPNESFRDAAVNHMRAQSSIEWVCSKDFAVSEKWDHWGINLEWKEGVKYTGIPYSDTKVSLEEFKTYMVDGTFTYGSTKWKEVPGNACMSSVFNSIQQFEPNVAGVSNQLMPSFDTFQAVICGEYIVPSGVRTTNAIITANKLEDIYEAFTNLKKGDLVITTNYDKRTSHIRMLVEEPTIVKNAAGKINPSRSSVKTIEQTNAFDPQRKDGVKTTWFVDHVYSFTKLYDTSYLPFTLESYSTPRNEMVKPHIILDAELKADKLGGGSFYTSNVISNFPIRYVKVDILNESGEIVATKTKCDMEDTRKLPLRDSFTVLFKQLDSGKYTLVLSAGLSIDSAELQRIDFTYTAK